LSELASNCDPPNLCLPSWNYRYVPPYLVSICFLFRKPFPSPEIIKINTHAHTPPVCTLTDVHNKFLKGFFFLAVLEFELRASPLRGRFSAAHFFSKWIIDLAGIFGLSCGLQCPSQLTCSNLDVLAPRPRIPLHGKNPLIPFHVESLSGFLLYLH
jgi:hypothetical protein